MLLSSTIIFTYNVSNTSQCIILFTFKTASASFGFPGSLTVSILRQLKKYVNKYIKIYLMDQSNYLKIFIGFSFLRPYMYIEPGVVGRVSTLDRKHTKYTQFLFGEILRKKGE